MLEEQAEVWTTLTINDVSFTLRKALESTAVMLRNVQVQLKSQAWGTRSWCSLGIQFDYKHNLKVFRKSWWNSNLITIAIDCCSEHSHLTRRAFSGCLLDSDRRQIMINPWHAYSIVCSPLHVCLCVMHMHEGHIIAYAQGEGLAWVWGCTCTNSQHARQGRTLRL